MTSRPVGQEGHCFLVVKEMLKKNKIYLIFWIFGSSKRIKFFLTGRLLRQKPIVVVKVKKCFVVADKKWQMSLRYPLIRSQNPKRLNYIPKTLNFNEL